METFTENASPEPWVCEHPENVSAGGAGAEGS
jgi:hypothetical protein